MAPISIAATDRVFVLTGAGISAESGLPTFRASDGLWAGHRIEDVCTPEALASQSRARLGVLLRPPRLRAGRPAQPRAHRPRATRSRNSATASSSAPRTSTTSTSAPAPRASSTCTANSPSPAAKTNVAGRPIEDNAVYRTLDEVGRCPCGARLRPHIVFFGEIPLEMDRIQREIDRATLMLVVGTSGSVYPAANFVHWARSEQRPHRLRWPRATPQRRRLHPHRRRPCRRGSAHPLRYESPQHILSSSEEPSRAETIEPDSPACSRATN